MSRGEQRLETFARGRWREETYRPGSVGLTLGGTTERLRRRIHGEVGTAWKINLYLPPAIVDEAARELGYTSTALIGHPVHSQPYSDHVLRATSTTLLHALRAGAPSLYADSMAYWLAVHMLTIWNGDRRQAASAPVRDGRIKRVLDFIEHHYAEDISLDRLAIEAMVSKFHFSRLFRDATGVPPHQWLMQRRLEAGRQLVAEDDLSVAEIALRCGFKRANHFAAAYRKRFGVSPLVHRRSEEDEILRS